MPVKPYIFLLWGQNFDENLMTNFITQCYTAGLYPRIVGIRGKIVHGTHGMKILPDMTLTQALSLTAQVRCLIVPCNSPHIAGLQDDPRIPRFFQALHQENVRFIAGNVQPLDLAIFPTDPDKITLCHDTMDNHLVGKIIQSVLRQT